MKWSPSPSSILSSLISISIAISIANAQVVLPSTFPNVYPGMPSMPYSTAWQSYFNVTSPLPGVSSSFFTSSTNNFAGNINVERDGHPNNTLFFWAWEKNAGSLTGTPSNARGQDPWIIWLNGGPGSSSLLGFFVENGPIHVTSGTTPSPNPFSWHNQADTIWIDQPVGTGWSTCDSQGYAADEEEIATDFVNFLANLVKVFPNLGSRPLHLMGESYAGVYIPYIAKKLFSMQNPPVRLKKLAIGNGAIGTRTQITEATALNIIQTHPVLINYNTEVYNYYKEQSDLCGFSLQFTYPQTGGTFPSLKVTGTVTDPTSPFFPASQNPAFNELSASATEFGKREFRVRGSSVVVDEKGVVGEKRRKMDVLRSLRKRRELRGEKRQNGAGGFDPNAPLAGRANGTIDSWYGCFLLEEMWDTALNTSSPWISHLDGHFNVYDVPDGLDPDVSLNPTAYVNDDRVRTALHAPTSQWFGQNPFGAYPFGSTLVDAPGSNGYGDPSPAPMTFFSQLMTDASKHGVSVVLYSGNDDSLVQHWGTQATIQNTTWGGIQGFSKPPSTAWTDDAGNFAGIVHQERNLTYLLVYGAGHQVPYYAPQLASIFLREFVLGNNSTGRMVGDNGRIIGGEEERLAAPAIQASNVVFSGSGATQGSVVAPSATVDAWNQFIQTATATPAPARRRR